MLHPRNPPNPEIQISRYKFKWNQYLSVICTVRYWEIWCSRFGGCWGCSNFSGNCHMRDSFGTVTVDIYNVIWCNVYWIHTHCVWMYLCHHFTIGHTVFYCNGTCMWSNLMQIVLYTYSWYCAITLLWERIFCTVTVPMHKVCSTFHAICTVHIYIVYRCTCATTLLFLASSPVPSLYHFWRYDWVQSWWR